ncbi:hypothetical protein L2E82_52206 [Cichorium intybus]|nr:hypothetical protein L2E82_52206 [Cichorium intybus]
MSLPMSKFIGAPLISTRPSVSSTSFEVNPTSHASISKNRDLPSCSVLGFSRRSLRYDPMLMISRRNFAVRSNITPPAGAPVPSGSPSGSMKSWVVGIVLTFVLPFFTHKWGPLTLLKNKVDTVVDTAESIMEAIEDVAGKVDKVEEAEDKLESLILSEAKEVTVSRQVVEKIEVTTQESSTLKIE